VCSIEAQIPAIITQARRGSCKSKKDWTTGALHYAMRIMACLR
jgi:hypothetical protein